MGCISSKHGQSLSSGFEDEDGVSHRTEWDGHIRSIRSWKVEPALTSDQLQRLRNEFWETRVEGREEMWQALRFAAEADSDELRDETVKAAGLRPANRRFTLQTTFDERGARYELPMYTLCDPTNLDEQPTQKEFKDAARAVADYIHAHESRQQR